MGRSAFPFVQNTHDRQRTPEKGMPTALQTAPRAGRERSPLHVTAYLHTDPRQLYFRLVPHQGLTVFGETDPVGTQLSRFLVRLALSRGFAAPCFLAPQFVVVGRLDGAAQGPLTAQGGNREIYIVHFAHQTRNSKKGQVQFTPVTTSLIDARARLEI